MRRLQRTRVGYALAVVPRIGGGLRAQGQDAPGAEGC